MSSQLSLFQEPKASAPFPVAKPKPPQGEFVPRDYQQEGIDGAFNHWAAGAAGALLRQPTGSGKTVSGSLIADRWLQQGENYRVLVLAHERQLIQQFAQEIKDVLHITPAIEMGDQHCTGREQIIVASRQTLQDRTDKQSGITRNRLHKFKPDLNWLLIIDEAHRWAVKLPSCKPIIEHFAPNPNSRRLGLTATPERTDKTSFGELFPAVALDYRLYNLAGGPSAVGDGWAVPYDQRFVTVEGVDFKNIREITKDFDAGELERILGQQETLASFVDPTMDLVGGRRTLIFNPGTDMAKAVAAYINAKLGYDAAVEVDGSFPDDERQTIYKRHQSGDFQYLSVCGLCREGYNDPGIEAVAIFRPTKSRPLAEQMKGRGCRPLRGVVRSDMPREERLAAIAASAKPNCMVVDLVGVTGLADCASTAHILDSSLPDEVIELANKRAMERTGPTNMVEEIHKAQAEIEAEQEAKRVAKENARKAHLARLEEERKRREEAEKLGKLESETKYHAQQIKPGEHGGKVYASDQIKGGATPSQINYIAALGLDLADVPITKGQAGRIINQLKAGESVEEVKRTNRLPADAPLAAPLPPSAKQLGFMKWKKIPIPAGCTKGQASKLIDAYKNPKPVAPPKHITTSDESAGGWEIKDAAEGYIDGGYDDRPDHVRFAEPGFYPDEEAPF